MTGKLKICNFGKNMLQIFYVTTLLAAIYLILGFCGFYERWFANGPAGITVEKKYWLIRLCIIFLVEITIFWIGMISVYLTSQQLGIRWRVLGLICGWIPIAHLVMLHIIIRTVRREVKFEKLRAKRNAARADKQICKTKYPILMVHGVFFRDFEHLNYWGRIPAELTENGAKIYYGNHNSAAAVRDSAKELETRIRQIVEETGCEKVNVIAHSKGGLDTRAAIALTSAGDYIASLTTINTPHRGCEFADYLLDNIPEAQQKAIEKAYNVGAEKLGDTNPDFMAAVHDLTSTNCAEFNEEAKDAPGIYYQSFGSKLNRPSSGRFPLNLSYLLVKRFDGPNDGLVGEKSFAWGEDYQFLTVKGKRGISHGDVIDFVGRLFQLSPYDAARKLMADFHLSPDKPPSAAALHAKRIRTEAQQLMENERLCFSVLSDYARVLRDWKVRYAPQSLDAPVHARFAEACHNLDQTEYYLDILCAGDSHERAEVVSYLLADGRLDKLKKNSNGRDAA